MRTVIYPKVYFCMFILSSLQFIDATFAFQVYNMDGRRFIDSIFSSEKAHSVTQVVMNLPKDAAEYLGLSYPLTGVLYIYAFLLHSCNVKTQS